MWTRPFVRNFSTATLVLRAARNLNGTNAATIRIYGLTEGPRRDWLAGAESAGAKYRYHTFKHERDRRILRDPRHRDAIVLPKLKPKSVATSIGPWLPGFGYGVARTTPGFFSFLDGNLSVFDFLSDPPRAHQLLRIFRRM